jgi:hypothetical protein
MSCFFSTFDFFYVCTGSHSFTTATFLIALVFLETGGGESSHPECFTSSCFGLCYIYFGLASGISPHASKSSSSFEIFFSNQ